MKTKLIPVLVCFLTILNSIPVTAIETFGGWKEGKQFSIIASNEKSRGFLQYSSEGSINSGDPTLREGKFSVHLSASSANQKEMMPLTFTVHKNSKRVDIKWMHENYDAPEVFSTSFDLKVDTLKTCLNIIQLRRLDWFPLAAHYYLITKWTTENEYIAKGLGFAVDGLFNGVITFKMLIPNYFEEDGKAWLTPDLPDDWPTARIHESCGVMTKLHKMLTDFLYPLYKLG